MEYARLDDDDGISGFVVSNHFAGISAFDRQTQIEEVLSNGSFSQDERRRVLMIAALTPEEYETVGARIAVHRVQEMAGGAVEIVLDGRPSDAEYVRGALKNEKGVQTTEPKRMAGGAGNWMSLRAKGTPAIRLTKEKAIRVLKRDPHIEVMSNA